MEQYITMAAAKYVYKHLVELHKKGEDTSNFNIINFVDENHLWMVDEWTHVGCCIVVCLDNAKLIDSLNKGQNKVLESLIGKTIKYANMTVDAELIRELLPIIIEVYFSNGIS